MTRSYPGEVPDRPPDPSFWAHPFLALPAFEPRHLSGGGRAGVPADRARCAARLFAGGCAVTETREARRVRASNWSRSRATAGTDRAGAGRRARARDRHDPARARRGGGAGGRPGRARHRQFRRCPVCPGRRTGMADPRGSGGRLRPHRRGDMAGGTRPAWASHGRPAARRAGDRRRHQCEERSPPLARGFAGWRGDHGGDRGGERSGCDPRAAARRPARGLLARSDVLGRTAAVQIFAAAAAVPHPLFDGLLVAWRGTRLVRQIAELHGVRPGLLGTLSLLRRTALSAASVVATDLAIDTLARAALEPAACHVAGDVAGAGVASRRMIVLARATAAACSPVPPARG